MRTVGSRCPFATSQTLSIPHVIRIFSRGIRTTAFITDVPMMGLPGPPELAAQFLFTTLTSSPIGSTITAVSSTMFVIEWIALPTEATNVVFTPGTPPFLSRLGGQLPAFDLPIPFP